MKKTISILLLSVVLFSCKKEKITVFTDIELNQQIDQRISDGILTFSSSERDAIFKEKEVILTRIIKNNPKIKFRDLYPKQDKDEIIYLAKEICVTNYSTAMTNCKVAMAVGCFAAVVSGVVSGLGASVPTTPIGGVVVGVGVGAAGLTASGLAYYMCSVNAAAAYKQCQGYL